MRLIKMTKYRCEVFCDKCKRGYTSIKKSKAKAPIRCKYCGSYKTRTIELWKVR